MAPSMEKAFDFLTDDDWDLLVEKGETVDFKKDQVILEEGERRRALYVILEGSCRVEQSHQGKDVKVADLGADEFFGDMNDLEGVGASANVIANEPVKVLIITPEETNTLLLSVPGLATRFYQSLALSLSRRLRKTTEKLISQLPVA